MGMILTQKLREEYERLWATCEIDYEPQVAAAAAARLLKSKGRYLSVTARTGVPWYWIAIVHEREAGGSFSGVLHNGEKIIGTGRKTQLVPTGRGPFSSWEEAAVDALKIKGLDKSIKWDTARFWYECERFNGFGYRNKGVPSPYLWSHTNHYKDFSGDVGDPGGGKYVADHVYNPDVHDKQLGAAAVLIALMKADPSITFGQPEHPPVSPEGQSQTQPLVQAKPEPVMSTSTTTLPPHSGKAGFVGFVVAAAAWLGDHWYLAVGLGILLGVGYWLWRKSRSKGLPKGEGPKADHAQPSPTKGPVPQETQSSPSSSDLVKDDKSPTVSEEKLQSE